MLIVKGGVTEAGARTASTHTSSLAGNELLWEAIFHQMGTLRVESLEDLMDTTLAFSFMQPPKGGGVAVVGGGGGASVLAADACYKAGLNIPELSPKLQRKLRQIIPEAGTAVRNPVDYSPHILHIPELFAETIKLTASSPDIHTVITHMVLELTPSSEAKVWDSLIDAIVAAGKACGKPVILVTGSVDSPEALAVLASIRLKCAKAGFPVYTTMSQAIYTLGKVVKYYCCPV